MANTGGKSVKFSKSFFEKIVKEEILRMHAEGLIREAPEDEEDEAPPKEKKPGGPASPKVADASSAPPKKAAPKDAPPKPPGQKPASEKGKPPAPAPDAPDPADDDIDPGSEDDESGGLNDELSGKTIQSISQEPKSKLVAGATEIVLTFNETTDPLKIIVTKTGAIRFFYRGALHNLV